MLRDVESCLVAHMTKRRLVPHGSTFIQDTRGEVEDRSLILGTSLLPANPSSCRWHDQRSRCSQHAPRVQPPGNGAHEGTQIRHDIDLYYCMGNHLYSTTLNIGYWWMWGNCQCQLFHVWKATLKQQIISAAEHWWYWCATPSLAAMLM